MTRQKHLKQLVRARMEKTGERYATARRHIVRDASATTDTTRADSHLTGNVPAATALRILLTAAGVRAPHTNAQFTEAMVYGIAGGIGIGIFAFLYEKENFASFYVAGRHDWANDVRYLTRGIERFGGSATVSEGVKPSAQGIAKAFADGQPSIIWLDAAGLPYKAMPPFYSGMASHTVVLYTIDEAGGTARIGDLSDEPIVIPLDVLTAARGRIKKDKHRAMSIRAGHLPSLKTMVDDGLVACRDGLLGANAVGGAKTNFTLEALRVWGTRLHGSREKEGWERMFAPGARLWRGLTSINEYIEHYGTGGGLSRPLFAEFLEEAAHALGSRPLVHWANSTPIWAARGASWRIAALPDDVPAVREAKELLARRAELMHSEGAAAVDEVARAWQRLDELAKEADTKFPLSDDAASDLRVDLKRRVLALYDGEVRAHEALTKALGG
jgi:hypothetical protein